MSARAVRVLRAVLACIALSGTANACAQLFVVPPQLWDRPRSGAAVMEQPAISQAVSAWLAHPGARLVVHHGAGQESYEQAEELRTWLIVLAIEGERVLLRSELGPSAPLRLEVLRD